MDKQVPGNRIDRRGKPRRRRGGLQFTGRRVRFIRALTILLAAILGTAGIAGGGGRLTATAFAGGSGGAAVAADTAMAGGGANLLPDAMTDDELDNMAEPGAAGAGTQPLADPVRAALARLLTASSGAVLSVDEEAAAITAGWPSPD